MAVVDDTPFGTSEGEEERLPEGAIYPLNSKKIVVSQLRRLASMLELPSEGTSATLRQVIEGKLVELGHEPRNTQVIVASVDSTLYLVDESGIIGQESEHVSPENLNTNNNSHVINDIETLRGQLREACLEIEGLRGRVHERDETLAGLRAEIETANAGLQDARAEAETLRREVKTQTAKAKRFWAQKCEQLLAQEAIVEEKDAEITRLQAQISSHSVQTLTEGDTPNEDSASLRDVPLSQGRRGKAPPVDPFKASDPEVRFDDWLPTLERAANWNGWSEGARLDPGSCALAAQEFRNALQREKESVSDYITRLERSFQIAYGHERLTLETRDAFLFSQLQAGLKLTLMESPAVSGSSSYRQLCVAAKQEEKRLMELKRRRQHQERQVRNQDMRYMSNNQLAVQSSKDSASMATSSGRPPRECYVCGKTDNLAKQCRQRKSESIPTEDNRHKRAKEPAAVTKVVRSTNKPQASDPMNYLCSDSDTDGSINVVRITDQGS